MRCSGSMAVIVVFISGILGCDGPESNPEEHLAKVLPPFNSIESNGFITINLITGDDNQVISTTLSDELYYVNSSRLFINGGNESSITIAIRDIDLSCMSCTIQNNDILVAERLNMSLNVGVVTLKNIVISRKLYLSTQSSGKHTISGTTPFFFLNSGSLYVHAFDLVSDTTHVIHGLSLGTEVHATRVLDVTIYTNTNVYYKGNPAEIRLVTVGSGQLIKS